MTWREIKNAVEQGGVGEDEEIRVIQCENGDGDHTFHKMKLANTLSSRKTSQGRRSVKLLKVVWCNS